MHPTRLTFFKLTSRTSKEPSWCDHRRIGNQNRDPHGISSMWNNNDVMLNVKKLKLAAIKMVAYRHCFTCWNHRALFWETFKRRSESKYREEESQLVARPRLGKRRPDSGFGSVLWLGPAYTNHGRRKGVPAVGTDSWVQDGSNQRSESRKKQRADEQTIKGKKISFYLNLREI